MLRTSFLIFLLALGLIPTSAQQYPSRRRFLVNQDLLVLANAGYSEGSIIDMLLTTPNRFDITAVALASLAKQGLSERILHAMLVVKARNIPATPEAGSRPKALARGQSSGEDADSALAEELPVAAQGAWYEAPIGTRVTGQCPLGNMSLSLTEGMLPKGLNLTTRGVEGIPRETGEFRFTIRSENVCTSVFRAFELVVAAKPILEVMPNEIAFSCATPAQVPIPRTILISSTWPNLPYTLEAHEASWLHVAAERGVTPDADSSMSSDVVTLTVDPSDLKPGTYRSSVVFRAYHGANAPVIPVVLTVGEPAAAATHPAKQ